MTRSPDPVIDAVRELQSVHDEELAGAADDAVAAALLGAILATAPREASGRRGIRARFRGLGRRGPAVVAIGVTLALAGGAGALLTREDGPPSANELRAGASDGVLEAGRTYENFPVAAGATPGELRRRFAPLGIEVELVPSSPLLAGRILSASGSGGGEQIRELRRDCPRATPCGKEGIKVPTDFSGDAVIALGREARPGERYVHVRSFQAEMPHCIGLVGLPVDRAEKLIADALWPQANPLWYDAESGKTYDDASALRDRWVVDAVKAGGYLDEPDRSRPPRVVLAVAHRPAPPPAPIRSGPLETYQRITQQGC